MPEESDRLVEDEPDFIVYRHHNVDAESIAFELTDDALLITLEGGIEKDTITIQILRRPDSSEHSAASFLDVLIEKLPVMRAQIAGG